MHVGNDCDDRCRTQNEAAARGALERRADRTLSDTEWAAAQARLSEFVGILRVWNRTTTAPRLGNVEGLCRREA